MKRIVLVLGGVRSGKSRFAEKLAEHHLGPKYYVAMSEIFDEEMQQRVHHHVAQRGAGWQTTEEPLDVVSALQRGSGSDAFQLVECLTMWINNLIHYQKDVATELDRLCASLGEVQGTVVLVANEVGLGIVPDNTLARRFSDDAGRANQRIAALADDVYFIAAGLPMTLKGSPPRLL